MGREKSWALHLFQSVILAVRLTSQQLLTPALLFFSIDTTNRQDKFRGWPKKKT